MICWTWEAIWTSSYIMNVGCHICFVLFLFVCKPSCLGRWTQASELRVFKAHSPGNWCLDLLNLGDHLGVELHKEHRLPHMFLFCFSPTSPAVWGDEHKRSELRAFKAHNPGNLCLDLLNMGDHLGVELHKGTEVATYVFIVFLSPVSPAVWGDEHKRLNSEFRPAGTAARRHTWCRLWECPLRRVEHNVLSFLLMELSLLWNRFPRNLFFYRSSPSSWTTCFVGSLPVAAAAAAPWAS